jgi:TonB family protein
MNLILVAALGLALGVPMQVKNQSACDHAAPPAGMRWVCTNNNPCDCQLAPKWGEGEASDGDYKPPSPTAPAQSLACRILSFAIPAYPEAARQAQKQGMVSAMLVLTPEGTVEGVRIQSGDAVLARAAETALRQWRFTAGNRVESIPVSVRFVLSKDGAAGVSGASLLNTVVTAIPVR